MAKHSSGKRVLVTKADVETMLFYFAVPFGLLLIRGPWWAALLVGLASALIGWWRSS